MEAPLPSQLRYNFLDAPSRRPRMGSNKVRQFIGAFYSFLCTLYHQHPCQEVAQFGVWDFRSKTGGGVYLAGGGLGAEEEKWNASEV